MYFSKLAQSIDILRPYVKNDASLVASPSTLHISIAQPSPDDAAKLNELGWKPSPVYPGVWDFSTLSE